MRNSQIRTSSPTNPSAISFLTKFPPEIRNCVYGLLFKRENPVLLHNADAFHKPRPSGEPLEDYYRDYEDEIGEDERFRLDFHEGLALLSSCRQIYDEASGILYGGNTFVFSRVLDGDEDIDYMEGHEEYFQVNYAGTWLTNIGSQFTLLTNVVIDADAMCNQGVCRHSEDVELLPLLRLIWKNPDALKMISFGSSSGIPYTHDNTIEAVDEDGKPRIDRARMLNNVLTALAVEDVLDIRKYAFSSHLMSGVAIVPCSKYKVAGFVRMKHKYGTESRKFLVTDEGKTIRWMTRKKRHPFRKLPLSTRERIAGLILHRPEGVTIDLNTHTIRGVDFGIARIGLVRPRTLGDIVSRVNRISIEMTSDKTTTDFDKFKKLNHLFRAGGHPWVLRGMICGRPECDLQTIILEIAPAEVTALSAIRINFKEVVITLRHQTPHPKSTIRITLTPPSHTGAPQQSTTVLTVKLRRQVFLLLSDYVLRTKEALSASPGITAVKALLEDMSTFPDIWIDGHGNLLHASAADMDAPLKFKYGKLSLEELGVLGCSRATSMEWMYKAFTSETTHEDIAWNHVITVWQCMRPLGFKKLMS